MLEINKIKNYCNTTRFLYNIVLQGNLERRDFPYE